MGGKIINYLFGEILYLLNRVYGSAKSTMAFRRFPYYESQIDQTPTSTDLPSAKVPCRTRTAMAIHSFASLSRCWRRSRQTRPWMSPVNQRSGNDPENCINRRIQPRIRLASHLATRCASLFYSTNVATSHITTSRARARLGRYQTPWWDILTHFITYQSRRILDRRHLTRRKYMLRRA